jgi:hypothetical protein
MKLFETTAPPSVSFLFGMTILFELVGEESQIEASKELPKGLIRRAKADSDPDYDWDD